MLTNNNNFIHKKIPTLMVHNEYITFNIKILNNKIVNYYCILQS